jgi:hypothetical protein
MLLSFISGVWDFYKFSATLLKKDFFQRSRFKEYVRDQFDRDHRIINDDASVITKVKSATGVGKVGDLIKTISEKSLLSTEYHFLTENCKHFAQVVFNELSSGVCSLGPDGDLLHPVGRG